MTINCEAHFALMGMEKSLNPTKIITTSIFGFLYYLFAVLKK